MHTSNIRNGGGPSNTGNGERYAGTRGTRVEHLLECKGHRVVVTGPRTTVHAAATIMAANRVGSVFIRDGDEDEIVGIFSERDCVSLVVLERRDPDETIVAEVMNREVHLVTPQHEVEHCLALITEHRCRHLGVVSGRKLVGVISIGDCVALIGARAVAENRSLLEYITGRYPG
jgi:signal-transduction protein with cAMP-binding, CBS, and nucleotidyltransferase domain